MRATHLRSLALVLSLAAVFGLPAVFAQETFQSPPNDWAKQKAAEGVVANMSTSQDQQTPDESEGQSDDAQDSGEQENPESNTPPPPPPPGCIDMFGQRLCRESEEVIAQRLISQGPTETTRNDGTSFSAQGFVRGGWPVAVDFQPQPNTRTYLSVSLYDPNAAYFSSGDPVRITIDENGQGGRQVFRLNQLELPGLVQEGPIRIATLFVTSVRLREDGSPSRREVPVQVFGMGVGPSAVDESGADGLEEDKPADEAEEAKPDKTAGLTDNMPFHWALLQSPPHRSLSLLSAAFMQPGGTGSMSLTELNLGDGVGRSTLPASGRLSVPYGFVLRRPFDLVRAELLRDCRRFFCNGLAASSEVRRHLGRLSGQAPLRRAGTYWLSVRAWLICPTPDFRQCADLAAWTTGRAGPLLVER